MAPTTGNQSANVSGSKFIDSRCIVEFRPDNNWKGEYGFDWYRRGDAEENINGSITKSHYGAIVGEYCPKDPDYGDNAGTLQIDKSGAYPEKMYYADRLAREEYPIFTIKGISRNYIAPYISLFFMSDRQWEEGQERFLPNNMLYEKNGNYYAHDFCKMEARVKLIINAKNIKQIKFVYDKELSVTPKQFSDIPDGHCEDKSITIRFNYFFKGEAHKAIKVFAYHKDGFTKTFAGQINVVKCVPKAIDVCFVNVKIARSYSNVSSGFPDSDFIETQKKNLSRFLAQAHVIPNITEADLDLDINDLNGYTTRLTSDGGLTTFETIMVNGTRGNGAFDRKLEQFFNRPNVYKVFFIGELGYALIDGKYVGIAGKALDIPSKTLTIYKNPDESVVCHEILHCFGLWHSFSNESKHTFEKYKTSNIMDYSTNTYTLWRWQWNKIRNGAEGTELVH